MDNYQRYKLRLPDGPNIGRKQLHIVTGQHLGFNATLRHPDSSPMDKETQRPPLAAVESTPPLPLNQDLQALRPAA